MPRQLSAPEWAAHFHTLEQDGFCIIPAYFDGAAGELAALAAAQHRVLDEWEQVKYDPPAGFSQVAEFPCSELLLNRAMVDHGLIDNIGKRWLGTNDVHIRVGLQLARYPGFRGADTQGLHIDNGNNSLLPNPAHDVAFDQAHRRFGQIGFWTHLDAVGPGQAPLQLLRRRDRGDMSKAVQLVVPAGTVCAFGNYVEHSAGNFTDSDGQRFTWGFGLGRADHCFEGFRHYTSMGSNPHFIELIASLTPAERCYFRFPKVGDPCYTEPMLAALEARYPGWDRTGEYAAAAAASLAAARL